MSSVGARVILILAVLSAPVFAQKLVSARAGTIYFSEGAVAIDGRNIRASNLDRRPQIEDGQTLTLTGGHGEVLLGAGAVMWVANQSKVKFDDTRVADVRVDLQEGAAMVEVKSMPAGSHLRFRLGETAADLDRVGLYRFDASRADGPVARIRVYEGLASLNGIGVKELLREGQQATLSTRRDIAKLDRKEIDEFHYWSALRSFQLETETGTHKRWHNNNDWMFQNASFGVEFPDRPNGSARAMYLAASEAGLVNAVEGSGILGNAEANKRVRVPYRLGRNNFLRMEKSGRAEVFLGVGVVARIAEGSQLRMIDTSPGSPVVRLDEGTVLIEVSSMAKAKIRVRVADSVTDLLKPGVYEFDAKAGSLLVYGGESSTLVSDVDERARTGQVVNLKEPVTPAKFDMTWQDGLFKWAALRSFQLYTSTGWFMADWNESSRGKFKHKQYGERTGRGGPPQLRPRRG
ncbi:MAG: hypothetical protein ABI811_21065 [Acidobacteriota bacterium]